MQACLLIFMLMSVLPMPACLVPTEAIISFGITKGYEPHLGGETKSGPLQKHWQSSLGVHALTAASPPPLLLPPHAILPMSVCTYFQKFSFRFRATMLQHNLILAYISPKKNVLPNQIISMNTKSQDLFGENYVRNSVGTFTNGHRQCTVFFKKGVTESVERK